MTTMFSSHPTHRQMYPIDDPSEVRCDFCDCRSGGWWDSRPCMDNPVSPAYNLDSNLFDPYAGGRFPALLSKTPRTTQAH